MELIRGSEVWYVSKLDIYGENPTILSAEVTKVYPAEEGKPQGIALMAKTMTGLFFDTYAAQDENKAPGTWHFKA